MSLPEPAAPRKPPRLGLYLPFLILGVSVALWTVYWLYARHQVESRLDAAAAALTREGYPSAWTSREIGGYPFRLDVTWVEPRIRAPGGWALTAPRLEAEANAYAPTHWMIAAPAGMALTRPEGGPVIIGGKLIRASLSHIDARPPSFSFEGVDLTFHPAPGAQPFALSGAGRLEFHLRAGPDDEGGVFVDLQGGKPAPGGLFARIAGDRLLTASWNSTLSKMSTFSGTDWPGAVRAWTRAGGSLNVRNGGITAGDVALSVAEGQLSAGSDGRLSGAVKVTLRQGPRAMAALADAGLVAPQAAQSATEVIQARQSGDSAQAALTFLAGRTLLGPVSLGAAPKAYDPR